MGPYAGYMIETFVTLLAVCALAFVVLVGARRLGIGRPRGPIQLMGQLPLDARRAIYLVEVGGRVMVVGASEAGLTKIGELAASELTTAALEGETVSALAANGASNGARRNVGFARVLERVFAQEPSKRRGAAASSDAPHAARASEAERAAAPSVRASESGGAAAQSVRASEAERAAAQSVGTSRSALDVGEESGG